MVKPSLTGTASLPAYSDNHFLLGAVALYPREVVRVPEPRDGRVVMFLDGSGVKGQPPKAGAAAVQVKGVGQETEVTVDRLVCRPASHGEVQTVADVVGELGEDVTEVWMVVDAEADMDPSGDSLPSRCIKPCAANWCHRCTL